MYILIILVKQNKRERLTEDDMKELGLKMGDRKRVAMAQAYFTNQQVSSSGSGGGVKRGTYIYTLLKKSWYFFKFYFPKIYFYKNKSF